MIGKTAAAMPGGMTATQLARRNANEQARLDAALTDLIEHRISFKQVLSLKVQALAPQWVLGIEMRPERVGHFHCGRLHGGVISAVLDAMGGSALMCARCERSTRMRPQRRRCSALPGSARLICGWIYRARASELMQQPEFSALHPVPAGLAGPPSLKKRPGGSK